MPGWVRTILEDGGQVGSCGRQMVFRDAAAVGDVRGGCAASARQFDGSTLAGVRDL